MLTNSRLVQLLCMTALFILSTTLYAKQNTEHLFSDNAPDYQVHDIFQTKYAKTVKHPKEYGHFLKQTYLKFKQLLNIPLSKDLKVKISQVRSGPLDKEMTQMVDMAPGIQTHDGFKSEAQKGYGIKFSYQFD